MYEQKANDALDAIQNEFCVNYEQISALIFTAQVYAALAQAEQLKRIADRLGEVVESLEMSKEHMRKFLAE